MRRTLFYATAAILALTLSSATAEAQGLRRRVVVRHCAEGSRCDRVEDRRDRREDVRDRREDRRDARFDGGWRDRREDRWDRAEDVRDRREDRRERRRERRVFP